MHLCASKPQFICEMQAFGEFKIKSIYNLSICVPHRRTHTASEFGVINEILIEIRLTHSKSRLLIVCLSKSIHFFIHICELEKTAIFSELHLKSDQSYKKLWKNKFKKAFDTNCTINRTNERFTCLFHVISKSDTENFNNECG